MEQQALEVRCDQVAETPCGELAKMTQNFRGTRIPPEGDDLVGVLVTGASSDIGTALCRRLERRQAKVIGTYRSNRPCLDSVVFPGQGIDLSLETGLDVLLGFVEEQFRGPFAVVHCVGDFWEHAPLDRCSPEVARRMITSHYLTLYGVLHRLLPVMAKVGGGRIIALSCTSTGFYYPEMAAFTPAKSAIEALVRCVANEWLPYGVSANAVALSTIGTAKVKKSPSKPLSEEETYVTPEELAVFLEELLFLSSPHFSGNVVRPLKYSHTFYNRGYFERNPHSADHQEE